MHRGLETPETPQLYQVLESKTASVGASALMGSSHQYVVPGAAGTDSVDLEQMDDDALKARFEVSSHFHTRRAVESDLAMCAWR